MTIHVIKDLNGNGELPYGYDHKFTYSNIGYNLKSTDLSASISVAQLDKLNEFIKKGSITGRKLMILF